MVEKFGDVSPREWANESARKLARPEVRNTMTDEEVSFLRGQFPTQFRLSPEFVKVGRLVAETGVLDSYYGVGEGQSFRYMHLPPMIRFVAPGNESALVPPHRDDQYNDHLRRFVTVWIPLVDIDSDCGGVVIYDKLSASENISVDGGAEVEISSGAVREWHQAVDTSDFSKIPCSPMKCGSFLTFGPGVLHGSMPNRSDRVRLSMDLRFFLSPTDSTKSFLDFQTNKSVVIK